MGETAKESIDGHLSDLRAPQQEIEREWTWLRDALNTMARARAEQASTEAFDCCKRKQCGLVSGAKFGFAKLEIALGDFRWRNAYSCEQNASQEIH